jgi:hypothetical protein
MLSHSCISATPESEVKKIHIIMLITNIIPDIEGAVLWAANVSIYGYGEEDAL